VSAGFIDELPAGDTRLLAQQGDSSAGAKLACKGRSIGHLDTPQFVGLLVVVLGTAKALGALAQRIGQPAVLGELVAGVLLGSSVLGLVDPQRDVLHLFADLGMIMLLFEIGLETNLRNLLQVGGAATVVALVGAAVPFALGYAVCWMLGFETLVAVVVGATLTATSVGITARVLADLNRLQEPEIHIILGAAVIDDVIGLVILAVVLGLTAGHTLTVLSVAATTVIAFGFLGGTLLVGRLLIPPFVHAVSRIDLPGTPTMLAVMLALGLAWLASAVGSAMIIGAFAAGLLLRDTPHAHEIERGVAQLGNFFVPIFFVAVGAAVDVGVFNPLEPSNRPTLLIGGLLILAAVIGKFLAGYAPVWFKGNKKVIGVGMIPRGEVGLVFAQTGLAIGVLTLPLFSAVTMMVLATTVLALPILKYLLPSGPRTPPPPIPEGIDELVTEP
jgi:Kef-type K+ transport system membrane component KefB